VGQTVDQTVEQTVGQTMLDVPSRLNIIVPQYLQGSIESARAVSIGDLRVPCLTGRFESEGSGSHGKVTQCLTLARFWATLHNVTQPQASGVELSGLEFATNGQSASMSWCRAAPLGPRTRFYMFFSLTCTCFFFYCALSDERTGLYFAVHITHWSESRRTHNHILLSHLRLGSLSVASYDSQGYHGGILTRLHTGQLLTADWEKLLVKHS
jgi:hypothetical protein